LFTLQKAVNTQKNFNSCDEYCSYFIVKKYHNVFGDPDPSTANDVSKLYLI